MMTVLFIDCIAPMDTLSDLSSVEMMGFVALMYRVQIGPDIYKKKPASLAG